MASVGNEDLRATLEIYSHPNAANLPEPSTADSILKALETGHNAPNMDSV